MPIQRLYDPISFTLVKITVYTEDNEVVPSESVILPI